jgi:hypothetical protein
MLKVSIPTLSTLQNTTLKLRKLRIPFVKGSDCIHISDGLTPLVLEVLGSNPLPACPLDTNSTQFDVYAGSNPVMARLTRQKRLLVHLPREQKLQALAELLEESKDTKVCIIVANDNQSKDLKHQLADKGINSSYVIDHNSDRLNTNKILITARNRVSSPLFALDNAEMVIIYDAVMLIDAKSIPAEDFYSGKAYETTDYTPCKIDLSMLFQADSPTLIPTGAKVLALLSDELPLIKLRELWNLLSIESLSLDASRTPITSHEFRFVSFIHHELPVFDTDEPSSFQVRKQAIWSNPARNLFIGQVVKKLSGRKVEGSSVKGQTALNRVPAIEGPANIIIVAENNIQLRKLHDFYSCEAVSGYVSTSELINTSGDVSTTFVTLSTLSSLRLGNDNPCLILRIDGGVGALPTFNLGTQVCVLDLADKNKGLSHFANSIDQRRQAYCNLGWTESGRPVLESKWLGNEPKEENRKHIVRRAR